MIALPDVIAALEPFLRTFGAKLTAEQMEQYGLALEHVNPGDLDDALADLRKSHGFRNAPLPAEILDRCNVHRKRRQVPEPEEEPPISVTDGELRTLTIKGIGSLKVRVLPDEHPALKRYACLRCKDTGWEHLAHLNPGKQPTFQRCGCVARNPVLQEHRTHAAESARKRKS